LIEELGKEGVNGHEKVGIEEEKVFEDEGASFEELLDESCEKIETEGRDSFIEEPLYPAVNKASGFNHSASFYGQKDSKIKRFIPSR